MALKLKNSLLALSLLVTMPSVWACADVECSPPLALQLSPDACGLTGLPFLAADNDTRTTLALWAQAHGGKPLLGWDEARKQPAALSVPFATADWLQRGEEGGEESGPAAAGATSDVGILELATRLGVREEVLTAAQERDSSWLEGRCSMNRLATTAPWLLALQQSGLATEEVSQLAEARLQLVGLCQSDTLPDFSELPASSAAAPFSDYLRGASAFYQGDFATALPLFTALSQQAQPWLKETASYLLARVAINQAQLNAFDEYGFFDASKVEKAPLAQAEQALTAYLHAYPQGHYAASAKGLYRRIYWLSGNSDQLAASYQQALHQAPDTRPLFNEIDLRLLGSAGNKVALPAQFALAQDLRRMRPHVEGDDSWQPILPDELLSQQASFTAAGLPGEFAYLQLAQRYYVQQEYAGVVQAVAAPAPGSKLDLLTFSQQMLRGMALLALQQWPQAEAHWNQLWSQQPDAQQQQLLQLAQAMTLERAGRLDALFAKGSWITSPTLRDPLLRFVAPADLLRQLAQDATLPADERNTALFTLLYKALLSGHYSTFLKDVALVSSQPQAKAPFDLALFAQGATAEEGYACPALQETVQTLSQQPKGAKALNCLAEFVYRQGWDSSPLGEAPAADQLAGSPDRFGGAIAGRLAWYRSVIADAKAPASEKSYALYRAINCFATSGYNHCGSEEIAAAERKRWFMTLKKSYGKSSWAQQQKIYW